MPGPQDHPPRTPPQPGEGSPATHNPYHPDPRLTDRKVIVAVTGGIACYKAAYIVSHLAQAGVAVRVLMTESATQFVTPLTFRSLSNAPVVTSLWDSHEHHDAQHVALARWCDLMVIAPASANTIAKLAAGLCDDAVSLTAAVIGSSKPILLAPAMNADMWATPVTQRNIATVKQLLGCHTVGPESGWQACRTTGPGRMSEPEAILEAAMAILSGQSSPTTQQDRG